MNITLINLPLLKNDIEELTPPLGLLCLIEAIKNLHLNIKLLDLNLEIIENKGISIPQIVKKILSTNPSIVGITSMLINSHIGIEICRRIKRQDKSIKIVFGGAHYSSLSDVMVLNYMADFVIKGEGEKKLFSTILSIMKEDQKKWIFNYQYGHPWNSYKYLNLDKYFSLNKNKLINMEIGRGCKYKCSFCYSASHWGKPFYFPIETNVYDVKRALEIGVNRIFFVNDNFANNKKYVKTLCDELKKLKKMNFWSCYLSPSDIDQNLVSSLSSAGCDSIYIGIDSTTKWQNKFLGKSFFLNFSIIEKRVRLLRDNGVFPTVALIIDPFSWKKTEFEIALKTALKLRLLEAEISLHYYTIYNDTMSYLNINNNKIEYYPDEIRARIMFDCPEIVYSNKYSKEYPEYFPFHSRTVKSKENFLSGIFLIHVAQYLISNYPYELNDLINKRNYSLLNIFNTIFKEIPKDVFFKENIKNLKSVEKKIFEGLLLTKYGFRCI